MYVIQATLTNSDPSNAVSVLGYSVPSGSTVSFILPADRTTWRITSDSTGGYSVTDVLFYDGVTSHVDLAASSHITGTYELGYIAKTGRFVSIT